MHKIGCIIITLCTLSTTWVGIVIRHLQIKNKKKANNDWIEVTSTIITKGAIKKLNQRNEDKVVNSF